MKRAGNPVTLDDARFNHSANIGQADEIPAVDEVLERLDRLDTQQARVAELRYFGGLSVEETAGVIGISARTVKRDCVMAKGWLRAQLAEANSHDT
jgi:RNA polymerase sigma-70 factor (ECF subfamily)